jgi:hypothetical protein
MQAHRVAKQKIARAAREDRRWEAMHVAIDRRQQGIGEIVPVGVERSGAVAETARRDEHIVHHRVRISAPHDIV